MKIWLWFWIILLVIIHTVDMELTQQYVGDDWATEAFLPMQLCIKNFGVTNALWISRIFIYLFIFLVLCMQKTREWRCLLTTITILYWMSMTTWLITLGYLHMPPGDGTLPTITIKDRQDYKQPGP